MILARFAPQRMTTAEYEEVKRRLTAAGHFPPDGLLFHACFGDEGTLRVTEGWRDRSSFAAIGEHLMPILDEVGLAVEPEVLDLHVLELGDDPPEDRHGLIVRYEPEGLTRAQYDEVNERMGAMEIEAAGHPPGLVVHALVGPDGDMQVGELWTDMASFKAMQEVLQPVLREVGIRNPEPRMWHCRTATVFEEARRHAHV
jgi:hypothetical protein